MAWLLGLPYIDMININLLPLEIKREVEKKFQSSQSHIPLEVIVGSFGGIILIVVLIHLMLVSFSLKRIANYRNLDREWKTLESRRTVIDGINEELKNLKLEESDTRKLFLTTFHDWSRTLSAFSVDLPKGIWFNKMTVEKDDLILQGSAITRDKDEMVAAHSYVNQLKSSVFLKTKFVEFSLDSVQKHKVQKSNVVDFLIKGKINPKVIVIGVPTMDSGGASATERLVLSQALPGIPESAKANTRVLDRKPIKGGGGMR